jgi:uncharacterized membrane protein
MERMLTVIFDSESKAYEATRALRELDGEGSIAIHALSVIQKNADGTVSLKRTEDDFPIRTIGGTAIGSLIGLLGGPVGLGIGAATGTTVGMLGDLYAAGVNVDFVNEVSGRLAPEKFAVVAEVSEEWTTPVDTRMEAMGGVVSRTWREYFEEEMNAREVASLKAEIEQLKAEEAQAQAQQKAKLHAKIDALNSKLETKLEQAKQRSEQIKNQTEAKIKALQQKVAKDDRETIAAIQARIADIRNRYETSAEHARSAIAGQLRKTAERLEKVG